MNSDHHSETPSVKDIPRKPPKFDGQYISPDSPIYFLVILGLNIMGNIYHCSNFSKNTQNLL